MNRKSHRALGVFLFHHPDDQLGLNKSKTMKINKWWEQLQYQCPNCKEYLCFKLSKEGTKYYYKKCSKCGFENRREKVWAEYKHENGKVFLRSNIWKKFKEVELLKGLKKEESLLK